MTETIQRKMPHRIRSRGPHPGIIASVSLGLMLIGLIGGTVLAGGTVYPTPFVGSADLARYFQNNGSAVRLTGFLQFGAAVPLGICAATIYARQLRFGIRVPGPAIGYFGGIAAATLLMISGLVSWALSWPEVSQDTALTRAMTLLGFAVGGVGFVVALGLLVAGLAVPAVILGLLPRWLAWLGLILAALCELSFLSLLVPPLDVLLPVGRFGAMLWLVIAGFLLPVRGRGPRGEGGLPA